jgi:ABC-type phosphate/phosphonate transport system substrate-binding protein
MYDWPDARGRMDAFWSRVAAALQARGIDGPADLARPDDLSRPWRDPGLLIGQTCGLPYVSGLCGDAVLVARPDYGLEHAHGGTYQSAIICHADAPGALEAHRGGRVAINEFGSQSGCNALAGHLVRQKLDREGAFFREVVLSGAHRASAVMVAEGTADIAAIDAVAWALFEEFEPAMHARLKVLAWTSATPALPYITSCGNRSRRIALQDALMEAATEGPQPPQTGVPHMFMPTEDGDFDPIREMALKVKGLCLAPGTPALGA